MGEMRPLDLAPSPPPQLLSLRAHPFSADSGLVAVRHGLTVQEMLHEAAGTDDIVAVEVRINGHVVPAELWPRLRPKPAARLEVTALPASNMNANWRAVLMIVVTIVVFAYTGYLDTGSLSLSASQWGTVILMTAAVVANALVKPPTPLSDDGQKKWNQLTGNSNQINPGGPIPHVLGAARYFPPHAAMPYAVATGDHSYQYCLFDLGYNVEADDVSDLRIGETPLSAFEGVTYQISTNPSLYRNDTSQLAIGVTMDNGDQIIRTTALGTETISLDFLCPQGFYGINDTGTDKFGMDMYWDVHYRPVGSGTWLTPPSPRLSNLNHNAGAGGMYTKHFLWYDPFAFGLAWDVPAGQYEVRITNRTPEPPSGGNTYIDMVILNSMLSVRNVPASRTGTMKLAMRIRADNQLNGVLQTFSLQVDPKFPVYNEASGTWSRQRTTNAGWLYHYLLHSSPATVRKVPAARMNLPQILDFVDFCDRHEFETRMVVDTGSTVGQVVDMLLRTSAGERTMTDGKYGVTFVPDTEPVSPLDFAPTEVDNFRMTRTFARIPHALRIKFRNPLAGWQPDEIIVLDDGYSYRGVDARGNPASAPEPTLFETLDLQATMLPQQAWRLGRMHFAQGKFSSARYNWTMDAAALKATKGTPVRVAHDVPEWGVGFGRIQSLTAGGPTGVATLRLDAEIETEPGSSYRMQIRGPSGTQAVNCTPHSPRTATFYLHTMPTDVQPGDVGILGITGVEQPTLLVTWMQANSELDFNVAGVAWDPRAAPYWADPPEDMVSEISGRPYLEPPDPPQIVVDGGGNEGDNAGINRPVVNIHAPRRGAGHLPVPEMLAR